MRKLSNLFMVLSLIVFCRSCIRAGRGSRWRSQLGRDRGRIFHGVRFWDLRFGAGQSHCGGGGRPGSKSRGPTWDSAGADSWFGADRVPGAVHAGYHLRQSEVEHLREIQKPQLDFEPGLCCLVTI